MVLDLARHFRYEIYRVMMEQLFLQILRYKAQLTVVSTEVFLLLVQNQVEGHPLGLILYVRY